jgi:hypothetical protein
MKGHLVLILGVALIAAFSTIDIYSQQDGGSERPAERPLPQDQAGPQDVRANMLRRLGLNSEQMATLRRMNAERRPKLDGAHARLREANRRLDESIYSDTFVQEDYDARLRAVQDAQNEILRLRFEGELAIRKVLTIEQLTRFREMRARFEMQRQRPAPMRNIPGPNRREQMMDGQPARRPVPPPRNDY